MGLCWVQARGRGLAAVLGKRPAARPPPGAHLPVRADDKQRLGLLRQVAGEGLEEGGERGVAGAADDGEGPACGGGAEQGEGHAEAF